MSQSHSSYDKFVVQLYTEEGIDNGHENYFRSYYGTDTSSFQLIGENYLEMYGGVEIGVGLTSHEMNKEISVNYTDFSVEVSKNVSEIQ